MRAITFLMLLATALTSRADVDLSNASILLPKDATPRMKKSAELLAREIAKRTDRRLAIVSAESSDAGQPCIRLSLLEAGPAEGFKVACQSSPARVEVMGRDERGVLFGVGYLLRKLQLSPGQIQLEESMAIKTAPRVALRGHQLGYRPKTNSYDAWDLSQWEEYFADLAVFGTNAVELVPPKTDDDLDSPHFPRPPIEMMVGMSKLADDYDLDVWVWYPAIDGDYADARVTERAVREWTEVLAQLPRLDAIFVPTADPGKSAPGDLMPMLEKQAAALRKHHPHAEVWVSVQGLTKSRWEEMLEFLADEPTWLTGIGYGPQSRVTLPELRKILPARYPIRRYPDITHCIWCQYPTVDWDLAFALTEGREAINPRPVDQSTIFRAFDELTIGFITYSEGCNDDVNKIIWSGLGWNPDEEPATILRDYARYFIGSDVANEFAEGLLGLEKNWRGPIKKNTSIPRTLALFQELEKQASPERLRNWRFQQALYRAYYDAFVQERDRVEMAREEEAMKVLAEVESLGTAEVIGRAEEILADRSLPEEAVIWRQRVFDLAEDLYQSIHMQLSVPKYKAIEQWRGANLDSIDVPLNDSRWLMNSFVEIKSMATEDDRRAALRRIIDWEKPGPGSFYDDLGDPEKQPRLARSPDYARDPASLRSSYIGFEPEPGLRRSWCTYVDGLFETPVMMEYNELEPTATYKVRVTYASDRRGIKVKLVTDTGEEIHPFMARSTTVAPIEFPVPQSATQDGALRLEWHGDPERGGNGRGPQVAEIWLLKQ